MKKKLNQDISNIAYHKLLKLLTDYFPENKSQYIKKRERFITELNNYLILLQKFEQNIKSKKNIEVNQEKLLRKISDRIILIGDELEKEIDLVSIKKEIKELFRECIGKWAYKSHIMKRSFDKPRGYSGR